MADNFRLPFLSVREQAEGGNLTGTVREDMPGGFSLQGRSRVVLLIHGFNVDLAGGRAAYSQLCNNLRDYWGFATPLGGFVGFAWPGDVHFDSLPGVVNDTLSAVAYPLQITTAIQSGEKLAAYLGQFSGPSSTPLEIIVIAHSLGSRVTLEFVKALQGAAASKKGIVVVKTICLMAAAVPVELVDSASKVDRPTQELYSAATAPRDRVVLHSRCDKVLHFAFPPGELFAGEGSVTAVGRDGDPAGVWTDGKDFTQFQYDHGSYWSGKESAAKIGSLLGLAVPSTLAAAVLAQRILPEARVLPSSSIEDRILATRTIGLGL